MYRWNQRCKEELVEPYWITYIWAGSEFIVQELEWVLESSQGVLFVIKSCQFVRTNIKICISGLVPNGSMVVELLGRNTAQ